MLIKIPANYKGITLDTYTRFKNATTDVERISVIANLSTEEAEQLPINEVADVIDVFNEILNEPCEDFVQTLFIGKKEYGLIPNFNKMSLGEFVDLSNWGKKPEDNVIQIMSVLYRPITKKVGKKYLIEKYNSLERELNEEAIKEMTMANYYSALLFFSTLRNELESSSLEFLESQIAKMSEQINSQV